MNITIKATGHELTTDMKTLVEEKLGALEKLVAGSEAPAMLECEIEQSIAVERAGAKYHAEGNLTVDGRLYRAAADGVTLEEAVDRVRDELLREVKRARGRERNLVRRGGAALKRMLRLG